MAAAGSHTHGLCWAAYLIPGVWLSSSLVHSSKASVGNLAATWIISQAFILGWVLLCAWLAISYAFVPGLEGTLVTGGMWVEDQQKSLITTRRTTQRTCIYVSKFLCCGLSLCSHSSGLSALWSTVLVTSIWCCNHRAHKALQRGSSVAILESIYHICAPLGYASSYEPLSFVATKSTKVRIQMRGFESQFNNLLLQ